MKVLRQFGRPVPEDAQDTESDAYFVWLAGIEAEKDQEENDEVKATDKWLENWMRRNGL